MSEQEMRVIFQHDSPPQVTPDTCDAEQVEYTLEVTGPSMQSLLSRIASVSNSDHDVFTDYQEDPLFPR